MRLHTLHLCAPTNVTRPNTQTTHNTPMASESHLGPFHRTLVAAPRDLLWHIKECASSSPSSSMRSRRQTACRVPSSQPGLVLTCTRMPLRYSCHTYGRHEDIFTFCSCGVVLRCLLCYVAFDDSPPDFAVLASTVERHAVVPPGWRSLPCPVTMAR